MRNEINAALALAALLRPSWPAINARIDASGAPVCRVADADLRSKLKSAESQLGELRDERVPLRTALDEAKTAYSKSGETGGKNGPKFRRAAAARDRLAECDEAIDALRSEQEEILRLIGGGNGGRGRNAQGPRSGDGAAGNGWATAAHQLDLAGGVTRLDVPARDLLAAGFNIEPGEGLSAPAMELPFMQRAQPRLFLYPAFPRGEVDQGDLALTEFRQTGSRTVEGTVARDPVATSAKAKLGLTVELVTPKLVQWAVVVENVPAQLFNSVEALRGFLENELRYQIDLATDAHCLAQLAAAAPPAGLTGATLIEQSRNAVAAMRELGANPTVLALSPTDAAALDTQKTGTGGLEQYVFGSKATGASPLWGNQIVEVADLEAPMVIDPLIAGVLYADIGTLLIDPYSGMDTNEVRIRVEINGLLHVRDVAGVYVIAKEEEGE